MLLKIGMDHLHILVLILHVKSDFHRKIARIFQYILTAKRLADCFAVTEED